MISDTQSPWGNGSIPTPLPWQHALWQRMKHSFDHQLLSHAYLLSGEVGAGVEQFAESAAAALLCDTEGFSACGHCESCSLVKAGTHPDMFRVGLEEGAVLKIAQIRAAIDFASATANRGGYRCIVIKPAEAMNVNAANALLKLLEEPGDKTVIFLVGYSLVSIPATLRSRCQTLYVASGEVSDIGQWLQDNHIDQAYDVAFYHQRPLLALIESQQLSTPSFVLVAQAFSDLLEGRLSSHRFYDAIKTVDTTLLIDHLISACLNKAKSQPLSAELTWFDAIDALIEFKRGLLKGSTVNQSLFYQAWCNQLLSDKSEASVWA